MHPKEPPVIPADVYGLVLSARKQAAQLTAVSKWREACRSPELFYLQRQADKFILSWAAVFWVLKGWLTTKEASGGGRLLVPNVLSGKDRLS